MNGKIDNFSYKNKSVQIGGVWYKTNAFTWDDIKKLKKGDAIGFDLVGDTMTSIQSTANAPSFNPGNEVKEVLTIEAQLLREAMKEIDVLMIDKTISDDLKAVTDWDAKSTSLAIEKWKRSRGD